MTAAHNRSKNTKAAAPYQENTAFEKPQQTNAGKSSIDVAVMHSKSTAIQIQFRKLIALLRQGPKTTIELRNHGIMMPAARIFQLKNEQNHVITSELVPLYDENGFRHSKCARYHLIEEAPQQIAVPGVPHE